MNQTWKKNLSRRLKNVLLNPVHRSVLHRAQGGRGQGLDPDLEPRQDLRHPSQGEGRAVDRDLDPGLRQGLLDIEEIYDRDRDRGQNQDLQLTDDKNVQSLLTENRLLVIK